MTSSNQETQVELEGLIAEFNRVRDALVDAVSSLPASLRDEPFVGSWDVRDVVAHTVGWDYTNVEALPDFRAGRLPAFFADYDSDWAAINASLIERYRLEDWEALMASMTASRRAFVDAMRRLDDSDLDNVALWCKRRITLRSMMRAVSSDESEHVRQVRTFRAEHSGG